MIYCACASIWIRIWGYLYQQQNFHAGKDRFNRFRLIGVILAPPSSLNLHSNLKRSYELARRHTESSVYARTECNPWGVGRPSVGGQLLWEYWAALWPAPAPPQQWCVEESGPCMCTVEDQGNWRQWRWHRSRLIAAGRNNYDIYIDASWPIL